MGNEVARRIALGELRGDSGEMRLPLNFPKGAPSMASLDSTRIADPTMLIRTGEASGTADLVTRAGSLLIERP